MLAPAAQETPASPAKLTPRRRRQAERYHYLVADVVAHLARRYPARLHDEIEALAAEGLVLAASADDLAIPTPFARFAWKRMANHVRIQLRKLALFGDDVVRGEPSSTCPRPPAAPATLPPAPERCPPSDGGRVPRAHPIPVLRLASAHG